MKPMDISQEHHTAGQNSHAFLYDLHFEEKKNKKHRNSLSAHLWPTKESNVLKSKLLYTGKFWQPLNLVKCLG